MCKLLVENRPRRPAAGWILWRWPIARGCSLKHYSIKEGWLQQARRVPSPNYGPRPEGSPLDLLVIHCISLPPGEYGGPYIEQLFTNTLDWDADPYFEEIRGLEVSAHLLVRRDGELVQFVSFTDRAWHAGESCHGDRENCNDFSIGVELEGMDDDPYTEEQYSTLKLVTLALQQEYPDIGSDCILGHCDIAPDRKTDPGPAFDWTRFLAELD
jgi:N-acetyl-anhydromuramoyl-L-alanine amidase